MPLSHSSLMGSGVLPEGHGTGNVSGKVLRFLKMNLKYKTSQLNAGVILPQECQLLTS